MEGDSDVHAMSGGHGPNPTAPIFLVFFSLLLGATVQSLLDRFGSNLPYTVVLLVIGFFFAMLARDMNSWPQAMKESFDQWNLIDGHLFLFLFLPALLFGDAMGLNWHMWKKCLGQCLLLAGPGVLLGTVAVAMIPYFFFGKEWDIWRSLMFGSVLAATDPVAVVGIMKSLGASPKLTMIISGESLMNDGVAIVVFLFFGNLAKKSSAPLELFYHDDLIEANVPGLNDSGGMAKYAMTFFFKIAICGSIFGCLIGFFAFYRIRAARKRTGHTALLVQVALTLSVAYLSFFLAEGVLGFSGVLAVVVAAIVVGSWGWSAFVDRHAMQEFWHTLEYLMNTLLFFLSGYLMGRKWWDHSQENGTTSDEVWVLIPRLFFLYGMCQLIRFLLVLGFMPLLNRMGYGFNYKEAIVLSWGGLRGAVGLALAILVGSEFYTVPCNAHAVAYYTQDYSGYRAMAAAAASGSVSSPGSGSGGGGSRYPSDEDCVHLKWFADQCYFYICGFAFLTLLLNGTTTGHVLNYLGMLTTEANSIILKKNAKIGMKRELQKETLKIVPTLYVKKFTEDMMRMVEENCAMLQGAQHMRDGKGGVIRHIETTASGHKRRSMVGRIKTGEDRGMSVFLGAASVGMTDHLSDEGFESEDSGLSFDADFWTEGRSQEKAISLLYMRILRSEYQKLSDSGLMPRSAGTMLLESVDTCIELVKNNKVGPSTMNDLTFVTSTLDWHSNAWWVGPLLGCARKLHWKAMAGEEMVFNHENDLMTAKEERLERIQTLLCYIIGHRAAERKVDHLLGKDMDLRENAGILKSSKTNTRLAVKTLEPEGQEAVDSAKVYQVSCLVWEKERQLLKKYEAAGLLDASQSHHVQEEIDYEMFRCIVDLPEAPSAEMIPMKTSQV